MADDISYSEDGLPIVKKPQAAIKTAGQRWTAIFHIEGKSCDVVLLDDKMSWSALSGKGFKTKKKKKKKKNKTETNGSSDDNSSGEDDGTGGCSLKIKNVIGAKIHYRHIGGQKSGEGICAGLSILTFKKKSSNQWKEKWIVLDHPSKDLCLQWCSRISSLISAFRERPKKIKVFLQPFAGKRYARFEYKKVNHLMQAAGVEEHISEVGGVDDIKQLVEELDVDEYDSIVCCGGDGTVSHVVNALLTKSQAHHSIDITPGFSPQKACVPVGIIPCGTFNQIAYTVYGTDDPVTAVRHIILGHQTEVNVCSIFANDVFQQWAFTGHYGYFGSVLPFLLRYALLGDKRIEASFIKALTKSKFRSYECEVQFIPVSDDPQSKNHPSDKRACRKGCSRCAELSEGRLSGTFTDVVQELGPLDTSNGSSIIADMANESPYSMVKGDFINVSVLSMPALSAEAPLGMSKYTHINDGWLDLILVKNTDKKEFIRFLKRHGNHKNQLDFPFVEAHRVKEVKFHTRLKSSWKHVDHSYNEINYELKRKEKSAQKNQSQSADAIQVIDDLQDSESDKEDSDDVADDDEVSEITSFNESSRNNSTADRRAHRSDVKTMWAATNDGFRRSVDEEGNENPEKQKAAAWNKADEIANATDTVMVVSDSYKPTLPELERARRGREKKKKEQKKKTKDESKMKSIWNIDNEICNDLDLHFKCHQGLIAFHGLGVPNDHDPDEVKMGCLTFV